MWCWLICWRIVIKLRWLKRLVFKVLNKDLLLLLILLDLLRQDSCCLENNLFSTSLFVRSALRRLNIFLLSSILVFNRNAIKKAHTACWYLLVTIIDRCVLYYSLYSILTTLNYFERRHCISITQVLFLLEERSWVIIELLKRFLPSQNWRILPTDLIL